MKSLFVFSDINTLLLISHAIGEALNGIYLNEEDIVRLGYLPIHEAYYDVIMQVLEGFGGQYVIKRAHFGEVDSDGNQSIIWEDIRKENES